MPPRLGRAQRRENGRAGGGRHCWIKGDPTFESLRHAILEPEERVWSGAAPPGRHDAAACIGQITTQGTAWLSNATIPLNAGLVAVIGARGSGKTALADLIASGANVGSPYTLDSSFLRRASQPVNFLKSGVVTLRWGRPDVGEAPVPRGGRRHVRGRTGGRPLPVTAVRRAVVLGRGAGGRTA